MLIMLHGQLHYRCAIDLQSLAEDRDDWKDLVKRVREWVASVAKVESIVLAKSWFYTGDRWKQGCPNDIRVETRQILQENNGGHPPYWACYVENPCFEHHACRWRTDITITTVAPKQFRLIVVNQRWIRSGYLGEEPPPPPASVPKLITILLKAKTWKCAAGSEHLSATPITARVGYLHLLLRELESDTRRCPIVYVSREKESKQFMLDPHDLAKVLSGTAVVYVAENEESDQEMEELFPRVFRCSGGMIRVYQPRVVFTEDRDARRHRFFTPTVIQDLGPEEVKLQIVRSCARRAYLFAPEDITSIDELRTRERLERLRVLAGERDEGDAELKELINSVDRDNAEYKREIEQLREANEYQDMKTADTEDRLRMLEHEFDAYKQATQDAYQRCAALECAVNALSELNEMPGSLSDVLRLMGKIHTNRIVVLEEALHSATVASLEERSLPDAWRCLWVIATRLHDLYFLPDQPKDLERAFQSETGFGLALNEGTETKKRKKLMKLRKRNYSGSEIDITPHVKLGNEEPRCLRVHYYVDRENETIVIGHCGNHLDNYTTKSRR